MGTVINRSVSFESNLVSKPRLVIKETSSIGSAAEPTLIQYTLSSPGLTFQSKPLCMYAPNPTNPLANCVPNQLPANWMVSLINPTVAVVTVPAGQSAAGYADKVFVNKEGRTYVSYGRIGCCEAQLPFIGRLADGLGVSIDAATGLLALAVATVSYFVARWLPRPATRG